ncbi:MAG: general secretion pathway protein GspK, partial [Betaproteobacteria bacterium]|nr:general secretion pathway protein GspK [Betaproteobacteria bacterium]
LLITQGVAEADAIGLTDAILDWRDADSVKRPRGAEDAEYEAAGLNYKPANAAFQSIEELKLVFGMTPALYERLAPLISIYARQPGVNSQIASREVLRALPGVTDAQVDDFLGRREAARAAKLPIPTFQSPYANSFANLAVTQIRVEAKAEDGASFVREAIVQRLPNPKRSYTFLRWQEGRALEPSAPTSTPTPAPTLSPAPNAVAPAKA